MGLWVSMCVCVFFLFYVSFLLVVCSGFFMMHVPSYTINFSYKHTDIEGEHLEKGTKEIENNGSN
jgi:hypothetical protein